MKWRPAFEGDFPTLGWGVLEHASAFLPSPSDETKPLIFTDEQARRILRWYELDPDTGERLYRRCRQEEAKGWGKSPMGGAIGIEELAGPVCFDGWDANGQPVGVPWGTNGRPPAWVQIAAVSEDQTDNTYSAIFEMLLANEGRAADELRIDRGRTRLYLRDRPGRLEPVTAAAGSREGQRLTFGLLDETHLWTPRNGGTKLAATIRRNAAKMGGTTFETTNAPVLGEKSVAEEPTEGEAGVLHFANRPDEEPSLDWPEEKLRGALRKVYGDAWWAPVDRILAEIADPATSWDDALRFYFNTRTAGISRAVDPRLWDDLEEHRELDEGTAIGIGFDGSVSHDATVLRGCTTDGFSFVLGRWSRPAGATEWTVPRDDVDQAVAAAFARYRVGKMLCDPPGWRTEIERWQERHGAEIVLALDTNSPRRMTPIVDRWLTGIRTRAHTHDGDGFTTDQVKATRLRKVYLAELEDDRTRYMLEKDGHFGNDSTIADALAYEAAMTMETPPEAVEPFVLVRR